MSQELIMLSNNNFMKNLEVKQKQFEEKTKMASELLKAKAKDSKEAPGSHGECSPMYAMLLSMNSMLDMNLKSMGQNADHLSVCNNQLASNNKDVANMSGMLNKLAHESGNDLFADSTQFNTTLQVDSTKLSSIQNDSQVTVSSIKVFSANNENTHSAAQALLDLYEKMDHTKNIR